MTKKIILLLVLLSVSLPNYSQSEITLGTPYEVIDASGKYYFSEGNEILTVKTDRKTIHLQKLNADKLSVEKITLYTDFPEGYEIERITKFQNHYFFFYSLWDGIRELLFAREIDFEAGTFKGSAQQIISVDTKLSDILRSPGLYRVPISNKFDFYFSNDNSSLAIQYRLKPSIRNDKRNFDIIGVHVFDSNLTSKWNSKVEMPYSQNKMNNLDYAVDKHGNAYIVTCVYDDDITDDMIKASVEPNYHIEILKISAITKELMSVKVNLAGNFIRTIKLVENHQGTMTCAGYYNKGNKAACTEGIVLFKLGDNNTSYDFRTYSFPLDILNQSVRTKMQHEETTKKRGFDAGLEHLSIRRITCNDDGSMVLIGEVVYEDVNLTITGLVFLDYYNDMLVSKIGADGELAWVSKLPKRQFSSSAPTLSVHRSILGGGGSFYYLQGQSRHYMLFLDNEKNNSLPISDIPSTINLNFKSGFLTAYSVDDDSGEVHKKPILDTRIVKGMRISQFSPTRIEKISATSFVFEAYKGHNEDVLIKVDLSKE